MRLEGVPQRLQLAEDVLLVPVHRRSGHGGHSGQVGRVVQSRDGEPLGGVDLQHAQQQVSLGAVGMAGEVAVDVLVHPLLCEPTAEDFLLDGGVGRQLQQRPEGSVLSRDEHVEGEDAQRPHVHGGVRVECRQLGSE